MQIFHSYGLFGIFRWAHVIVAVMWMGLLWFFNFIQTPAYAELDPAARNEAFDKLTWRALWWFRWAAAATVVFGLLLLMVGTMAKDSSASTARTTGCTARPDRRSQSASSWASRCSSTCGS